MIKVLHIMNVFWYSLNTKILSFEAQLSVNMGLHSKKIESFAFFTGYGPRTKKEIDKHKISIKHINWSFVNWFSILHNIFKVNPDIIILHHSFGSPKNLLLQFILKIMNKKVIIGLDFLRVDFVYTLVNHEIKRIKEFIKDLVKYPIMYFQILLAEKLWCRTKYEMDTIFPVMKHSRNKFFIIPLGHNLKIGTSIKQPYILSVSGTWQDRKNLHKAIKVFSKVIKSKKCKFILVGTFLERRYKTLDETGEKYTGKYETASEYKQKIMNLIEKLKLTDYVEFVGIKFGEELRQLFKKAKIYYMPTKAETFGHVWLEAMAAGTPIVAMKNSGVQYIVKDGFTGFLKNTDEDQKNAILKLFNDEKLYKRIQRNCLKEAEKYKWKDIIKEWERMIMSVNKIKKDIFKYHF